ncbi:uncharacterized protein NPIL_345131 [Nephila pilipes]|uniref:Uncharacterized protein n=1 Tax=Nephila pilipes TaxID=299642 RepID=A0A8X6THI0_NEPPI|nr:uncharacterized protein NPIL_345131 [Nephila pilipes]
MEILRDSHGKAVARWYFRPREINTHKTTLLEQRNLTQQTVVTTLLPLLNCIVRKLFFEIFVLLYAVLVNLIEIMDGIDDENTFLLDDELHSDTDTDISSNYLDYSSDDSCSELSSDEDLSSFFSSPLGIILFYKKMEG